MSKEFHYKAIDTDGNVQSGLKIAEDEISLSKDLRAEGLNLINAELSSKFSFSSIKSKLENFGTVSTHDKIIIYRNISAMLNAGLSLSRAISVMTKQSKN
jgi:type II secretory pathway component PulF